MTKLNFVLHVLFFLIVPNMLFATPTKIEITEEIDDNIYYYQNIAKNKLNLLINNYELTNNETILTDYYKGVLNYYEEKIDTSIFLIDKSLRRSIQLKGQILFESGKNDSALIYFNKAIRLCKNNEVPNKQYLPFWYISRIDTCYKNYKTAFLNYDTAMIYKKRLDSERYRREAKLEEISSNIKNLEIKLTESKIKTNNYLILLLSALCVFLVLSLILLKLNKRAHIRIRELHTINSNIEEKLLLIKEQKKESFKFVKSTNPAANFAFANSETLNKLKSTFPELNDSLIKYALMFSQGLSNDMICELQCVQSSSIRMARYRIRKTLNLNNNADLQTYFNDALEK